MTSERTARRREAPAASPGGELALMYAAFDATEAALCVLDREERVVVSNRAFACLAGYSCEQLVGRELPSGLLPQGVSIEDCADGSIAGSAAPNRSGFWNCADGTRRWMVWSLRTLPAGAGGTRYRILSAIDRTPAFEAQSDLKSEREFVAALLWAVPALVVVTDGNGHVVHCNKAFSEATGLGMAQVHGRHVGEFTQMQELGGQAGRALAKPVPDREVRSHVAQLRHRDGSVREIAWNQSVIRDSAGTVRYAIASGVDVSAERTAVEELRTTHQRLRELGTDLERVREEERRRVARELHDGLGQTLGALRMDLEGMLRDVAASQAVGAAGERAEPVRRLSGVLEGMDAAIEDVRRIAADLRPLLLDDLGLGAAVEWLAENLAQRAGLRCRASVAQECADLCEPHATTLFRILQEALTNVSRHAQAGSVHIRLYPSPDRSWVCLDVRDDGVGLREEARARSRSLGLLGIRERALALGGSATIDSVPRRGTTLSVRLPLPSACEDRA